MALSLPFTDLLQSLALDSKFTHSLPPIWDRRLKPLFLKLLLHLSHLKSALQTEDKLFPLALLQEFTGLLLPTSEPSECVCNFFCYPKHVYFLTKSRKKNHWLWNCALCYLLDNGCKAKYFCLQKQPSALEELSKTESRWALIGSNLPLWSHILIWQVRSSDKPSQSTTLLKLDLIWRH